MKCIDCKYFKKAELTQYGEPALYGVCTNPKIRQPMLGHDYNREELVHDGIFVTGRYNDDGDAHIGPEFGCIHFDKAEK